MLTVKPVKLISNFNIYNVYNNINPINNFRISILPKPPTNPISDSAIPGPQFNILLYLTKAVKLISNFGIYNVYSNINPINNFYINILLKPSANPISGYAIPGP